MIYLTDYISEIRCPYCFSYVSILQKKESPLLIITCELCGKNEMSLNQYLSLINSNNIKSCNYCCKNIPIKELFCSSKKNNFLCKKCFSLLSNHQAININDYTPFTEIGKNCKIHKSFPNLFYCETCRVHICCKCMSEHPSHKIINICEEAKKKNNIEELKLLIKKEEKEIENEQKFGELILNSMSNMFENELKNKKDLFNFKKIFYNYFISNSNSYYAYENAEFLSNNENSDFFVNDKELKELEDLLNSININPNNDDINKEKKNNSHKSNKKYIDMANNIKMLSDNNDEPLRKSSTSVIKQSRRSSHLPTLPNIDKSNIPNIFLSNSNININNSNNNNSKNTINNNRNKHIYPFATPIKSQRFKVKKNIKQANEMINREIQNKSANFLGTNNNQENKIDNFILIKKLKFSIINMLYLGNNKILISIFSADKNLILGEIVKEKEKEKDKNLVNFVIIGTIRMGDKPIIHMEICDNGNILNCSDDRVIIFKIINNKINIKCNILYTDNNSSMKNSLHNLSCISLEQENLLVLYNNDSNNKKPENKNISELTFYSNTNTGCQKSKLSNPQDLKIISLEKISSNICVIISNKISDNNNISNKINLRFLRLRNNRFYTINEKEISSNEKNKSKIFINKLIDNYVIISESLNSFCIYDFEKNQTLNKFQCDNIEAMKIKLNDEQIFLYTVERKLNDEKVSEEVKMKKYLIKRINVGKIIGLNNNSDNVMNKYEENIFEINLVSVGELYGESFTNKINDMLIIKDEREEKDKNGSDKNLILLADNVGNIFYNYY